MKIGYDAKRIFFNRSGLGNYSRGVADIMAAHHPENEYLLFSPKKSNPVGYVPKEGMRTVYPDHAVGARFPSLWRSYRMAGSLRREKVDLFHGLSNELPGDIRRSGARSVVTLHDIIFIHFPELYKPIDRYLYTKKYRSSCEKADKVIAISLQTKNDLIDHWKIPEEKIEVVYQGCDPMFYPQNVLGDEEEVRKKYDLPENYILSVGTVERRKNLMLTVRAMAEARWDIPLVACGRRTPYADEVLRFAEENGLRDRVRLIHDVQFADLPAIYRMSDLFVYPSVYEGFGIPILEALNCGVPVVTTRGGVFPETGGDACLYVDPGNPQEMAEAIGKILNDRESAGKMVEKGRVHAEKFREESIARELDRVYRSLF